MSAVKDLGPFLHKELAQTVCGSLIGSGIARKVYAYRLDPTVVVKFEDNGRSFQNVMEWETWNRVRHTEHAAWFAPCLHISPCGGVLLQRRTVVPGLSEYPERMPAFLTDLKRSNFGMLDGRLVAHDYGLHLLMERGMSRRMRAVDWRGGQGDLTYP